MLAYQADPLRESLRRLGRRWTLLLLRDMAFLKLSRFSEFQRNNSGLTPRVLSRRLREMRQEGLIERRGGAGGVRYRLTPQGEDAVYILLALLRYGTRYHRDSGTEGAPPEEDGKRTMARRAGVGGPTAPRT